MDQHVVDGILKIRRKPMPRRSCYPCHRRKVKCDRNLPCKTCTDRAHPELCTYTEHPKHDERQATYRKLRSREESPRISQSPPGSCDDVIIPREQWDSVQDELSQLMNQRKLYEESQVELQRLRLQQRRLEAIFASREAHMKHAKQIKSRLSSPSTTPNQYKLEENQGNFVKVFNSSPRSASRGPNCETDSDTTSIRSQHIPQHMQFAQLSDESAYDPAYEHQAFPYHHVTPELFAKMDNYQVSESTNISDWSPRDYWSDDNSTWSQEIPQPFSLWQGPMPQLQNQQAISSMQMGSVSPAIERTTVQQPAFAGDARNVSPPMYNVSHVGFPYQNNNAYVQS